ncbi:MAG: DNA repair protein RecO [Ilumatobacteraceae bacterium]
MPTYRDAAVVLGSYKFGEADKVVVLLTQSHGKVRAVARGVRKTRSSIGARLEPMSHVDISLRSGRALDTVAEVRMLETQSALRGDLSLLQQGLAMVEAIDKMTPDNEPVPHLFETLVRGLRTLATERSAAVLGAFFWRLLAMEGHAPMLEACVKCGGTGPLVRFDTVGGGAVCQSCPGGLPVSAAALEILADIVGGRVRDALARKESAATSEVSVLAMDAMEAHLERRIRSLGGVDRHL